MRIILLLVLLSWVCAVQATAQFIGNLEIEINGTDGKTVYSDSQVFCDIQKIGDFNFETDLGIVSKTSLAVASSEPLRDILVGRKIKVKGTVAPLPVGKDTSYNEQALAYVEFGSFNFTASIPLYITCKKNGNYRYTFTHQQALLPNSSYLPMKERAYFDGMVIWGIR